MDMVYRKAGRKRGEWANEIRVSMWREKEVSFSRARWIRKEGGRRSTSIEAELDQRLENQTHSKNSNGGEMC